MSTEDLQKAFTSSALNVSHRIVMAPMTRMRASSSGVPNASAADYYSERATSGGLIISEGVVVHPRGKGFPNTPGLWSDEQVEAWKPIVCAVKAKGGLFFAQIWHVGRVSVPSQISRLRPVAATRKPLPGRHTLFGSANAEEDYIEGEALDKNGIKEVVEQFATAAKNAVKAGFDGVEIHGGNGYLLDTFVHDNINDRTDSYGVSLENRLRFPLEVVDAIIAAIGSDRTAIRLAPFHVLQQTLDSARIQTFSAYSAEMEKRGLAYVHMVEPRYDQLSTEGAFSENISRNTVPVAGGDSAACSVGEKKEQCSKEIQEDFSLWTFRKILKTTPLIGAGGYDAESARKAISEGRVDLVAIGRHFTSNPDLVRRMFEGLPLTHYQRKTFYTPGMDGYLGWKKIELQI